MNRLRRTLFLAALTALVALPALSAGPAHAQKKMEVAAQDDAVLLYKQYYDRELAYRQLRALGVSRVRMNVLWHQTMPPEQKLSRTKPRTINYNWALWDEAIARARAYGIKVHLNLTGEPPVWACGRPREPGACRGYKPNVKQFKQFARAAARHFGRSVDRYSIWNEPNWYTWLSPHKAAGRIYRNLYRAGYAGVKRGNRRAKVLMGETAPYFQRRRAMAPLAFLRQMVCVNKRFKRIRGAKRKCRGGALKIDGYAHHPYDFQSKPTKRRRGRDNVTMANLGALSKTLNKLRRKRLIRGPRAMPVYLTEHGYFVSGPRRISERKRARFTVKSYDMALKNRKVKSQLYYLLVSPPADHPSAFFDLGLIGQNGQPTRPYNALRKWTRSKRRKLVRPKRCAPVVRANC